jgi:RNA polymerase sigma-70 factor (ECF subfamily)
VVEEPLYRRESGRMIAALTRIFGIHNLALAEDVAQDAFCRALEIWRLRGVPDNPAAWLMTAAKRRAIDVLRRERTARRFAPDLGRLHESEWTLVPTLDAMFEPSAIKDDQLRMMFSCCSPRISEEAQIALILHLLCGFSVGEIAAAFLSSHAAIEKRITRAKHALAQSSGLFDLADRDLPKRLASVQRSLYLLFNEGYHGASPESSVRAELCREAIRLGALLADHPSTSTPATLALCALMVLNASRLAARVDALGNLNALADQDRSLWDKALIERGIELLDRSAIGDELSEYHIEAAISSVHARSCGAAETDWKKIASLYDLLIRAKPSPVVALNRAIAYGHAEGPERGLAEIAAIDDISRLESYPFYHAALGEFELRRGESTRAREHFDSARKVARNAAERRFLTQRADACAAKSGASV